MTERNSQVLVVGAGPAGCAAGIVLARAGAKVTVFDRSRFPRDKTCGDAISARAVTLLRELGCREALARMPHALVRATDARFPDGSYIRRRARSPGMIVPRLALDDALRVALEESGAELVQGVRIRELLVDRGRVVGVRGPAGPWRAEVVIAADGYGSVAWERLGRPSARGPSLAVSVRAYYRGVAFPDGADVAEHCFIEALPHGYAWVFPSVSGLTNVGIYQRADRFTGAGRKLEQLLDGFVFSRPDRFAGASRASKPKSWPLPLSSRPRAVSAPGLLAAGDAASFVDPLSGEGIWQALVSGMLAGRTSLAALSAGGLGRTLRLRHELECAARLRLPGAANAVVQQGVTTLLASGNYRNPFVRRALHWGYGEGWLA